MSGAWVEVWRGSLVESRHRVHVAVVDAAGRTRARAGDAERVTYARSTVKPIQALPLVADGGVEYFGFTAAEVALSCGSHNGEPEHVDTARSMLRKIGADEEALACGPHPPMHKPSAEALVREGRRPGRIHNNCSGKHAGLLALARLNGWPLAGYEKAEHPVQQRLLSEVARWTGMDAEGIPLAVDGCGVCTFALPLTALAGAFARLAATARAGDAVSGTLPGPSAEPAARVVGAMIHHPEMVAGTDRLCTALMRVARGRIFAKVGADGVYCAGIPGAELGIALKVEDGAKRAAEPALLAVLRSLGLLSDEEMEELGRYARPELKNTLDQCVGRIHAVVELEPGDG